MTASLVAVQVTSSPHSALVRSLVNIVLVYDTNAPNSVEVWQSSMTVEPPKSHVTEETGLVLSVMHSNVCSPGVMTALALSA